MSTWEEIGEKWDRAQQMGWQAVQAAMEVGEELQQKKLETPHGEFHARVRDLGIAQQQSSRLMRLALHRELIEEHKPESFRGALALLPKVPKKTGEKQIESQKEEIDKYEAFANESVKKKAEILAKKMVKVELAKLQNDAHDAVVKELKAVNGQLKKERKRIQELMTSADKKQQFYNDLVNKKMNGYDYKMGLKVLRQAVHPDREVASKEVKLRAMDAIKHFASFLEM